MTNLQVTQPVRVLLKTMRLLEVLLIVCMMIQAWSFMEV